MGSAPHTESVLWQVPLSHNLLSHLEAVNGRQLLYVDGRPFTVLAAEIPWGDLIYGRYKETETAYDHLYPAAEKIGLNALKVPFKWSIVDPEQGVYDFSMSTTLKTWRRSGETSPEGRAELVRALRQRRWHIYANLTGDLYAPMYIVEDEVTYPRAVGEDGVVHHNEHPMTMSRSLTARLRAFRAFMQHIKQVDSQTHTILMIQVENEIAVFAVDRKNPKMWRDHSPAANKRFTDHGFTDDLRFSAWDLSYNWIRRLTDAGAEAYPLPFL